ncbi:hypothetical protein QT971_23365 [Microcoleus sp. herbarium19]|uniref:hypothetical protein n=1 Tax=unclassified Microcoleus TaxID=2642155 RepID=UPI002FD6EE4A
MFFLLGKSVEGFIYFNPLAISNISLKQLFKKLSNVDRPVRSPFLQKPESRSKNKEGNSV